MIGYLAKKKAWKHLLSVPQSEALAIAYHS